MNQRFYAIVADLVGSPAELVSPDGDLAGYQRQTLWGTTYGSGASSPLRFPGQYADDETGLHYDGQRYYDPATGRYISPDPLGLTPAPNPHAYVPNPTLLIDPLGLMACTVSAEQGAAGQGEPGVPTYHRLESPTQPPEVAAQQVESGEVWGRRREGPSSPRSRHTAARCRKVHEESSSRLTSRLTGTGFRASRPGQAHGRASGSKASSRRLKCGRYGQTKSER